MYSYYNQSTIEFKLEMIKNKIIFKYVFILKTYVFGIVINLHLSFLSWFWVCSMLGWRSNGSYYVWFSNVHGKLILLDLF